MEAVPGPRRPELAGFLQQWRCQAQTSVDLRWDGVALSPAQAKGVEELVAGKDTDPELRAAAAPVVGALRPDAKATGERLKDFQPPIPLYVPDTGCGVA